MLTITKDGSQNFMLYACCTENQTIICKKSGENIIFEICCTLTGGVIRGNSNIVLETLLHLLNSLHGRESNKAPGTVLYSQECIYIQSHHPINNHHSFKRCTCLSCLHMESQSRTYPLRLAGSKHRISSRLLRRAMK